MLYDKPFSKENLDVYLKRHVSTRKRIKRT